MQNVAQLSTYTPLRHDPTASMHLAHERKMKEKYAIFDGDECATRHHSSNVRARRRSPMIISVCKCVWHSIYSMHLLHDVQCSLHPIFIFLLLHFRMRACVVLVAMKTMCVQFIYDDSFLLSNERNDLINLAPELKMNWCSVCARTREVETESMA